MDRTFEIRDGEINVEEIMDRIREKIRKSRVEGVCPDNEIEGVQFALEDRSHGQEPISLSSDARRHLDYINFNWDIENNGYLISSHRRVVGRFLVTGRQLVHGEVRRYLDPTISKQKEFNASAVEIFSEVARTIEQISARILDLENTLQKVRSEMSQYQKGDELCQAKFDILAAIEAGISQTRSEIKDEIAKLNSEIEERIESKVGQSRVEIEAEMIEIRRENGL